MKTVTVGERQIGEGEPCFIVAEIGNNHNGDVRLAQQMIRAFAAAGANAVKFQTFRAEDIVSPKVRSDAYAGWDVAGRHSSWIDFLNTLVLPREAYPDLMALTHECGMAFISTATSIDSAEFLADLKVGAIKVASMDLNHLPFLTALDRLNLPVLVSTGMGTLEEIEECVSVFHHAPLALLHCVSNYPLDYRDANLRNIPLLKERFKIPVGFSDHSLGMVLAAPAVALGASVLEKHVTLDRKSPKKAEHHFSMMPAEFHTMVEQVRQTEQALGTYERRIGEEELRHAVEYRRSLFLARDFQPQEEIKVQDIRCLRPGTSLPPKFMPQVIGARTRRSIRAFEPFVLEDLEVMK